MPFPFRPCPPNRKITPVMLSHHVKDIITLPQVDFGDLQILHEIVSLASVIPETRSFRAIWRAYDTVLAARQINPALDSVYFRFVLQLQGVEGKTLYDKFMQLLENHGVDISDTRFLETSSPSTSDYTRRRYEGARQRRNVAAAGYSGSVGGYDASDESAGVSARRPAGDRAGRDRSSREEAVRAAESAAEARREEVRQRRGQPAAASSPPGPGAEGGEVGDHDNIRRPSAPPSVPENAADALYNIRMRTLLRGYFRHWHMVTIQLVVRRRSLEQIATLHHRRFLLRQTFDFWQELRWFAGIERRVERQYESNLMSNAFSLWVHKTARIVQRTQEVRERILARKYFGAWRQLVLENNAKIRLFQLSGALSKWRNHAARRREMAHQAQQIFEGGLVHRAYWTWFFKLCGVLGLKRYTQGVAGEKLSLWMDRTEENIRKNKMADAFFRRRTLQVVFQHWSMRTQRCLEREDDAADHAEWTLARRSLEVWRRQTRLTPLLDVMVEFVNDRVADTHFNLWRTRASQSAIAARMARNRILRRPFRDWRLQVRRVILIDNVEGRIATSMLHEWVLQSRLREFKAHSERELRRGVLAFWSKRHRRQGERLEDASHEVMVMQNRRLVASALDAFRQRLRLTRLRQREAEAVYRNNILGRALDKWRVENDVCVQHEDWAEDAIYYFTVRRTLRRWVRAFKDSKRRRLRVAFHTLSRKTKKDLAGVVMSIWRQKCDLIGRMKEAARVFDRDCTRATSLGMLQHWRRRADDMSALRAAAETVDSTRLMRQHLMIWIDNHNRMQELEERAELLSESSAVRAAVKCFNAWETRSWHLHMLRMTADRKFERKRLKTLLRMWRDQALERIEARERAVRTRVHAPAGIDDTIDEEFGEDWVPPIHPGRSTTPVGNPNPSSMLTTPRRNATTTVVRNRLFVRTPAGTPASPLLRFSARRAAELGRSRLGR